jgi:hypothetical protein
VVEILILFAATCYEYVENIAGLVKNLFKLHLNQPHFQHFANFVARLQLRQKIVTKFLQN